MQREFDLVIFGASSYTGYFVIRELLLSIQNHENGSIVCDIKWAVAGRNKQKIYENLQKLNNEVVFDFQAIKIIEADVEDSESLLNMTKQTRLIVNTVGPYRFFGYQVVEACVQTKTHHLDISYENEFIERCALKHHKQAQADNILIISSCGLDAIPDDLGVEMLKDYSRSHGTIKTVKSFVRINMGPKVKF